LIVIRNKTDEMLTEYLRQISIHQTWINDFRGLRVLLVRIDGQALYQFLQLG